MAGEEKQERSGESENNIKKHGDETVAEDLGNNKNNKNEDADKIEKQDQEENIDSIENKAENVSKAPGEIDEVVNNETNDNKEIFAVPTLPNTNAQNKQTLKPDRIASIDKKTVLSDIAYKEPAWGGLPTKKYSITILKDGIVKDSISLENKSFITLGRLDECDVTMEHPSCSRYHAILQYCVIEKDIRKEGYYLYDLGSTHGTYLNKEKIKAKVFSRVRVGYQMKFGGSTRLYIMEGPPEDQEEEMDIDVMREKRRQYLLQKEENKQKLKSKSGSDSGNNITQKDDDEENKKRDDVTWGFGEDAVEEHINLQELFEKKKKIEVKDPKKTLRNFFEKEGLEFEYEMSVRGSNHVAKVRLPIETADSDELIAEGSSSNKKDAVLACAVEACKLIQAYDMMQNKCKENRNVVRRRELEANDFYDSDDDNYLDRTGSVEKKRRKRKQWAGKRDKEDSIVETHDSLKENLKEKEELLKKIEEKLKRSIEAEKLSENEDSLDDYMSSMEHILDKTTKLKLKRELLSIKQEIESLKKLIDKTKPALPYLRLNEETKSKDEVISQEEVETNESKIIPEAKGPIKDLVPTKPPQMKTNKREDKDYNLMLKRTIPQQQPEAPTSKKKRLYGAARSVNSNEEIEDHKKTDEEVSDWMPPPNQTGDGRTFLNDKFGY